MERENFVDSRKYAIKGTLVFTAQREQFTIMEDAYLVCDGKKVAGAYSALPEQYRQIKVLDASGKFVIPGTCDIHVHASQAPFMPHKHPFKVLGKILKTDSGTHGSSVMRSQTNPDSTIRRMQN